MNSKLACEQALLFGRAKQAARVPRFRVSSRLLLVRLLLTISLKKRACSQANAKQGIFHALLQRSCTKLGNRDFLSSFAERIEDSTL